MTEERIPTHTAVNEQKAPKPDDVIRQEGLEAPPSDTPDVSDIAREHKLSEDAGKKPDDVIEEEKLGA